jgi:signal transduction histidine kinase
MDILNDEINFSEVIQKICDNHKFNDETKDTKIEVQIDQNVNFYSDKRRLTVILDNIISNALKYQDKKKGDASFVRILVNCTKKKATISIEDNGIGIANEDHDRIFEMFCRATTLSKGSGLGMYIVKETLEKLNGKISLSSTLSIGTKFIIDIPNHITF